MCIFSLERTMNMTAPSTGIIMLLKTQLVGSVIKIRENDVPEVSDIQLLRSGTTYMMIFVMC